MQKNSYLVVLKNINRFDASKIFALLILAKQFDNEEAAKSSSI